MCTNGINRTAVHDNNSVGILYGGNTLSDNQFSSIGDFL